MDKNIISLQGKNIKKTILWQVPRVNRAQIDQLLNKPQSRHPSKHQDRHLDKRHDRVQSRVRDRHPDKHLGRPLNRLLDKALVKLLGKLLSKVTIGIDLNRMHIISLLWNTNIVKALTRVNQCLYTKNRQPSIRVHLNLLLSTVLENNIVALVQNKSKCNKNKNNTVQNAHRTFHLNIVLRNLNIIALNNRHTTRVKRVLNIIRVQ